MVRYYIDTCIWRDYYENRCDRFRPLGEWALRFIKKAIYEDSTIFFSAAVLDELYLFWDETTVKNAFQLIPSKILVEVHIMRKHILEANTLAQTHHVPRKDALHAVLARDACAIVVTRDEHFKLMNTPSFKPEELF
jgi:predicted nucleic acid-binding protein